MATISFRIDDILKDRFDSVIERKGLTASTVFREAIAEKIERIQKGEDHRMYFELDLKERVILATQYELLAKLAGDPEDGRNYNFLADVLRKGQSWHYYKITQSFSKEMKRGRAELVIDIMTMYDDLAYSYEKLDPQESKGLEQFKVAFPGFDGNYETEELSFANSFVTEDDGRFMSLFKLRAGRIPNSHYPTLAMYTRQLAIYRKYQPQMPQPFSAEIIRQILAE